MKIKPKLRKGIPVGATVSFSERDMVQLASILGYAVRSDACGRMLFELAAMCEGVTADANAYLDRSIGEDKKLDAAYDKIRKLFDPEYGSGKEV